MMVEQRTPGQPVVSARAEDGRWQAGGPGLEVECRTAVDGCAVLFLRGELDVAEADKLYEQACRVIDRPSSVVILELADLAFCDGSGLGCLVRIANYAEAADCRLVLAEPRPAMARILRIGQLERRFAVVPSPGDLRAVGEPDELVTV